MSVDNIVIPGGILATWQGPQQPQDDDRVVHSEVFDVTKVARRRARTLSVSLDTRGQDRAPALERLASVVRLNQATHEALQRTPTDTLGQASHLQRPKRSNTINLGGLGRSRVTGLSTPANPGHSLGRGSSISFPAKARGTQTQLDAASTQELENSYIFESLGNYQLPGQRTAPVISTPIFLARNSSRRSNIIRRGSSRKQRERSPSESSQFSAINVARRASIVVENVVEKVKDTITSALPRSSLEEVYEKAKIRQVQLVRSTFTQYAFEYTCYLLLLAVIYFGFIGYPLWNGLVLTIYYLFDMKLVVPAGTAIFLGVGSLYVHKPPVIPALLLLTDLQLRLSPTAHTLRE